jgi:hypothetical protein
VVVVLAAAKAGLAPWVLFLLVVVAALVEGVLRLLWKGWRGPDAMKLTLRPVVIALVIVGLYLIVYNAFGYD